MRRSTRSPARRRRRIRDLAALGVAVLGLALVLLYGIPMLTGAQPLLAVPGQTAERAPEPSNPGTADAGSPLLVNTPEEAESIATQELVRTPARPGQPVRVQVPRLGMDIPVLPMSLPADRRVNPPSNGFAYWISDFGPSGAGATNTTYLAAHSWNLGYAAFNGLMDIQAGTGRVQQGDAVLVTTPERTTSYRVTATAGYVKSTLKEHDDLWAAVPGRLVLVTCFQLNDAGATQNYVVYAEREGWAAAGIHRGLSAGTRGQDRRPGQAAGIPAKRVVLWATCLLPPDPPPR